MNNKYYKEYYFEKTQLILSRADITTINVDVIVNAANNTLRGGGGVDGAIHRRGGPTILDECIHKYPNGCPTGECRITTAGNLSARFVIHCVGPIYQKKENNTILLEKCYSNALKIAKDKKLSSIAFPSISTGVYGYPIHEASEIAVKTIFNFIRKESFSITKIYLIVFSNSDYEVYLKRLDKILNKSGLNG